MFLEVEKVHLIKKILFPAMQKKLDNTGEKAGQFSEIKGSFSHIKHIEYVDHKTPLVEVLDPIP